MGLLDKETVLTRNCLYEAGVKRPEPQPPLHGMATTDVAIIGGGYAGVMAALELAERGYSVTLLEAKQLGWGASGRNGGQVLVGYGMTGQEAMEAQLSSSEARQAWDISQEGVALLRQRIARHAIECEYMPGHLTLAVNTRKGHELADWVEDVAQRYHYELQPIASDELGAWIASERFHSGAFDPHSGHLHPLKYCLGLAAAAQQAGVRIHENTPALALKRGVRASVVTAHGELRCRYLLLAGNVYLAEFSERLAPELASRIMPVGTYIIATEPMDKARADALIKNRYAAFDTNLVLDYFRITADHRLLFGGGESYTTATPHHLKERMRQRMVQTFPQLADLQIPYVWGGFVDITMNQAPDLGRLDHNIYYLQGFSGHGLAMAGMAGKLAAEAIAGEAERFELLSRLKHRRFPGGELLRTPALVLGVLYYRLRDML